VAFVFKVDDPLHLAPQLFGHRSLIKALNECLPLHQPLELNGLQFILSLGQTAGTLAASLALKYLCLSLVSAFTAYL